MSYVATPVAEQKLKQVEEELQQVEERLSCLQLKHTEQVLVSKQITKVLEEKVMLIAQLRYQLTLQTETISKLEIKLAGQPPLSSGSLIRDISLSPTNGVGANADVDVDDEAKPLTLVERVTRNHLAVAPEKELKRLRRKSSFMEKQNQQLCHDIDDAASDLAQEKIVRDQLVGTLNADNERLRSIIQELKGKAEALVELATVKGHK